MSDTITETASKIRDELARIVGAKSQDSLRVHVADGEIIVSHYEDYATYPSRTCTVFYPDLALKSLAKEADGAGIEAAWEAL